MKRHQLFSHRLLASLYLLAGFVCSNSAQASPDLNLQLKSPLMLLAQETAEAPPAEAETEANTETATPAEATTEAAQTQEAPAEEPAAETTQPPAEAVAPAAEPPTTAPSNAELLSQIAAEKAGWKSRIWEPTWKSSLFMLATPLGAAAGATASLVSTLPLSIGRSESAGLGFLAFFFAAPLGAANVLWLQPAVNQQVHVTQRNVKLPDEHDTGIAWPFVIGLTIEAAAIALALPAWAVTDSVIADDGWAMVAALMTPVLVAPVLQTLAVEAGYQMALDSWAEELGQTTTAQQSLGGSLDYALQWAQVQR